MVDKQGSGVENCLLEVIFYSRDFHLASYACVIDIGDNVLIRLIRKLTFNLSETFLQKKNFYNSCKCPKCLP